MWRIVSGLVVVIGCGNVTAPPNPDGGSTSSGMLALAETSAWVPQNSSHSIAFTITRGDGATGTLTVRTTGLPAGVAAPDVTIAASDSSGSIALSASAAATLG